MRSATLLRLCALISIVLFVALAGQVVEAQGPAIDTFSGDKRTACEALMCLSSGERPHECDAPLKKFFSIKAKKPWKTIKKRKKFLKLCPSGDYDNRETHLTALAEGAGQCDMNSLLAELNVATPPYTKAMPTYCSTLVSHEYTTVYDLPILMEHCFTDHLQPLGQAPKPVWDWTAYDGYSDEPPMLNAEEVESFKRSTRLQVNHPSPICVTKWVDPNKPVPENALSQLLHTEVTRIDHESSQYVFYGDESSY